MIDLASNAVAATPAYASPGATATTGCTQALPCSLTGAIAAAGASGTVLLEDGTYAVASHGGPGLTLGSALNLRAAPGARPILSGDSTVQGGAVVQSANDLVLDGLTITGGYIGVAALGPGTLSLLNSSVLDNGNTGLYVQSSAIVHNSTMSGNQRAILLSNGPSDSVSITATTVVGNVIGFSGSMFGGGQLSLGADIFAGNSLRDCQVFAAPVDAGFNIDGDGSCQFAGTGSISGSTSVAASVSAPADNGGPSDTMALAAGSPAIGLVTATLSDSTAICGTPDQRGATRPAAPCDAGAYESAPVSAPRIGTTTLPAATVGRSYSATVATTGTPFATVTATGLPAGLHLDSTSGAISGLATASGTFHVQVSASNGVLPDATRTLDLVVHPALTITTARALPAGAVGQAYHVALAATGGADSMYTWSVATGSILPKGLMLSPGGVLSGTPTAAGTSHFTLSVNDPTLASFTLSIVAAVAPQAVDPGAVQQLANTGRSEMPPIVLALSLLSVGGVLTAAARRKRA